MEALEAILTRRSTRNYKPDAVEEEKLEQILAAAKQAPSGGNNQTNHFLVIRNPEVLRKLAAMAQEVFAGMEITEDTYASLKNSIIQSKKGGYVFCYNAPVMVVAANRKGYGNNIADCLKWYKAFKEAGCEPRKPEEGDLFLAMCDALIAAQNAVIAVESLGIGSCYVGDIMENIEEQRDILGLPPYVFPAAMLVFGYPTEQQLRRKKPDRADLKYIVNENSYHELSAEELQAMLSFRTGGQDYHTWMKAFCGRKYNSAFSREMSRSVRKYLEDFSQ